MPAYEDAGVDDIAYGDGRKRKHVRLASLGIDRRRAARAVARAEHVDTADEIAVGVESRTRTYEVGPPFLGIAVGGEGMAYPHDFFLGRIVARRVVADVNLGHFAAGLETEGFSNV